MSLSEAVGIGAGVRGGGDQRLHSPTAWLPPGYEPGAGGVALLPSSKRGVLRALGILDRRRDPMVAAERRGGAAAGAQQHTRAITARTGHGAHGGHSVLATITACTERARHTRHDHGTHASVTAHAADVACSLQPRCARLGHGTRYGNCMHVSLAAHTHGTAGAVDRAGPAASAARLTRRARRSG